MSDSPKPARPFSFDVSFDAPLLSQKLAEEVTVEEKQPTFSLNDLDEARKAGFEDGREAALKVAASGIEERIARSIESIAEDLSRVDVYDANISERNQLLSIDLIRHITEKLLPATAEKYGLKEIEQVLKECLPLLTEASTLSLHVNDQAAPEVERHLNDIIQINALTVRVNIIPDTSLGPSDCLINWGDGGAERNYDSIWNEIESILVQTQEKEMGITSPQKEDNADTRSEQKSATTRSFGPASAPQASDDGATNDTDTSIIMPDAPEPETEQSPETLNVIETIPAETPISEPTTES